MKIVCSIFGLVFGLTGISCFYNLVIGRHQSPPLVLFLLGVFSFAVTALCIWGIKRSVADDKKAGRNVILKTKIIDAYEKTSTVSETVRGTVGILMAGLVGGLIGASTAKSKRSTTFLIIYKDGTKQARTVPNGSLEYQQYIKYLE